MNETKPIKIIFFFLLIFSFTLSGCNGKKESSTSRPNVLLFLIDDFGYGEISFEGNTQIHTPNIDRIAENGIRFSRFYQSSGACAPTRASLLTGRYYLETGVWGVHRGRDFILRDEVTIADVLKKHGYVTGAFGKWHSGKTWPYFSWNRGFDVGVHPVLYQHFNTRMLYNNKLINVKGPVTNVTTDQVIRFIEENRNTPFFCYVPYQSIHLPYACPDNVFQKYKAMGYTDQVALLYGMTEVLDDNVGRILDALERLKLDENTIVMFLSDDGPSNNSLDEEGREQRMRAWPIVYRGGKGGIWQGGMVTPFYMQWKNHLPTGKVYHHLSGVIDLFPTILDICGIKDYEPVLPLAGRSLWPVIQQGDTTGWEDRKYFDNSNFYQIPRDRINMEFPEVLNISLHYQDFKLIRNDRSLYSDPSGERIRYMLYNLKDDPKEENDLVEEYPELVQELRQDIDEWYEGIIRSGRAFGQAVYEVGNREERISGINPDGYYEKTGDVQYESIFGFSGWTTPGSSMTYEMDVVEEGDYRVHLYYQCDKDKTGADFQVYTSFDTAHVKINDERTSVSGTLHLPAGRQRLTIRLQKKGRGEQAVSVMNYFLVERIPGPGDREVIGSPGFELSADGYPGKQFFADYASTGFLTRGGRQDEPVLLAPDQDFDIRALADTPEQIVRIEVFRNFQKIQILEDPPFTLNLKAPAEGYYTLNVSCVSKAGVTYTTRALIQAKSME
jgi:arylsulfatase A-like enzyme